MLGYRSQSITQKSIMKLNLDELNVLIQIADSGSFVQAAERLQQEPSAISRLMKRLEQKLEVTLINRTTRRLQLTDEGELLLRHARAILDSVHAAQEALKPHDTPSGVLRVSASEPFLQHAIVPHLAEFIETYPKMQLELHSSGQLVDLVQQRIDVALRHGELTDSTLHARLLGHSQIRVLASPDYLKNHSPIVHTEDLAAHRTLGFIKTASLNTWPLKHSQGEGYPITPSISANNGEVLLQLAIAGAGVVSLADFLTRTAVANGQLIPILTHATVPQRQAIHAVYYRSAALAARVSCFLDFIQPRLGLSD